MGNGVYLNTGFNSKAIFGAIENAEGEKAKDVRKNATNALKEQNLWDKQTKKYINGNFWQRTFGLKPRDSKVLYKKVATENRMEEVAKGTTLDVKKDLAAKLQQAGYIDDKGNYDIKTLQEFFLKHAGGEKELTYSHAVGEKEALGQTLDRNGVVFTNKEIKKLSKALGGAVEAKYNAKELAYAFAGGGAVGTGIGAAIPINVTQTVGTLAKQTASITMIPAGAIAGSTIALGVDMIKQAHRNESQVADKVLQEDVNTLKGYNAYIDNVYANEKNKKGADIMKGIAKHYAAEDGALNKLSLEYDLKAAAGEGSVLNYKEALSLYSELESGKKKPTEVKDPCDEKIRLAQLKNGITETELDEELEIVDANDKGTTTPTTKGIVGGKIVTNSTHNEVVTPEHKKVEIPSDLLKEHKVIVQNGETLAKLAKKYGVTIDQLIELNGVKKFTDDCGKIKIKGFLVGQTIKLPEGANIEAAKNNKSAAEAIKDYENMWKAKIKEGKDPCEDDHKISKTFHKAVKEELTKK